MLASEWKRNDRESSVTASRLGKIKIGGAASSTNRARTISSIAELKSNDVSCGGRAMIGQMRRAMLGRNLW